MLSFEICNCSMGIVFNSMTLLLEKSARSDAPRALGASRPRSGGRLFGVPNGEDEIACLACLSRRVKNRAGIGFENLQPVAEVIGVAHLRDDAEVRAKERACQFGNQLFACVSFRTETALQVAAKARRMCRPMTEFMQDGAIEIAGRNEGLAGGNTDEIVATMVEGFACTFDNAGACRGDEAFRVGAQRNLGQNRRLGPDAFWQAVTLFDIEDGEAFEKRNLVRVFALLSCAFTFGFWNEAVGVTDCGAVFALADAATQGQGLPEGEPFLRAVTVLDDGHPENKDVHTGIKLSRRCAARHSQRCTG